jgi:hypothetical protein
MKGGNNMQFDKNVNFYQTNFFLINNFVFYEQRMYDNFGYYGDFQSLLKYGSGLSYTYFSDEIQLVLPRKPDILFHYMHKSP